MNDNPFAQASHSNPMAPWHMWGGTQTLTLRGPSTVSEGVISGQVAKVSYKRPETWSFFFGARVIDGSVPLVGQGKKWTVEFDLVMGIGRTMFRTYRDLSADSLLNSGGGFAKLTFQTTDGENPATNIRPLWTTTTYGAPYAGGTAIPELKHFCAQDIQCVASLLADDGLHPSNVEFLTVEATAMFAPMTHTRPDWFSEGEQFRGDEIGGT